MRGLKFSLVQLIICIGLILFIAFTLVKNYRPQPQSNVPDIEPAITIPFQNIKIK